MLTKQTSSDDALKCPLELDASGRLCECGDSVLEKNSLAIGGAQVNLPDESEAEAAMVSLKKSGKRSLKRSELEKITEKLYNLEPCTLPEKSLNLELDLYQMEDY